MKDQSGFDLLPSDSPPRQFPARNPDFGLAISKPVSKSKVKPIRWGRYSLKRIGLFITSLYLFILAITLMKSGIQGITPLLHNIFVITNEANSFGFGWLFAYVIMSGSPVAAFALTFLDAGILEKLSAFTMISGSRLGASFVVLFIGFLYVLRGRDRATSLSMGLLSLIVTASTYIPGLIIGVVILDTGLLDGIQLQSGSLLQSITNLLIEPLVLLAVGFFPNWMIFFIGLGIILLSFNLFDRCLPKMTLKESQFGGMARLVYQPIVMFALGAFVTLVSMSVSLSLGLLVPLSNRGFIRRENVIPYIMGANITTFVDTLLAAVLLRNPAAFTVVLVEMLSISIISILILISFYNPYQRAMLQFASWITTSNRNLAIFMIVIFATPILLILI
jgi:sodium-dependent phosphate cotransporter